MNIINQTLRHNQKGMASFIVVVALMLIISLIVLTFATVVRNEQRQTLDRQLSSRAFYAAESGVNLAREALADNQFLNGKNNCAPEGVLNNADYDAGAGTETEVTCLTIDTSPKTLLKEIGEEEAWILPLNGLDDAGVPTALNGLNISWQEPLAGSGTSYAGCSNGAITSLPAFSAWPCSAPLLRVDIVQTSGSMNIGTLNNSLATFFLYPTRVAGAPPVHNILNGSNANKGTIVDARCAASAIPKHCRLQISGMMGTTYYARIVSLYRAAKVELSATNSSVTLAGAQAVVDSTGRSVDVLRRIQVRLPLTNSEGAPSYGLFGAAGICKRYQIMPPSTVGTDTSGVQSAPINDQTGLCSISN